MEKIHLCNLSKINNNKYYIKWIDLWKDELIVFRDHKGNIKIFSSICPHFGGEIYFDAKENNLKCKWHGWRFCIDTGRCKTHKILSQLKKYDIEVKPNNLKNYDYLIENDSIYAVLND